MLFRTACRLVATAAMVTPVFATAAPAAAQRPALVTTFSSIEPADRAVAIRGAPIVFRARTTLAAPALEIAVSATRAAGPDGRLEVGRFGVTGAMTPSASEPAVLEWTPPAGAALPARPGVWYWQLRGTAIADGLPREIVEPIRTLIVRVSSVEAARRGIAARYGHRGTVAFEVSTSGVPADVGVERFVVLAKQAGRRWGLRFEGRTTRVAGIADDHSVVGFASEARGKALATQRDFVVSTYRRARRCGATSCALGPRRLVGRKIVERDIVVDAARRWQPGPDYPGEEQYDLETVLLHELGHFAGNKRHAKRCTGAPMLSALGAGEWWHAPLDWWQDGCGARGARVAGTDRPSANDVGVGRHAATSSVSHTKEAHRKGRPNDLQAS